MTPTPFGRARHLPPPAEPEPWWWPPLRWLVGVVSGVLLALALTVWAAEVARAEPVDTIGIAHAAAQNNDLPDWLRYEMVDTIRCESRFNPSARGDYGASRGLAQLHRDGDELARFYAEGFRDPDDPESAAEFMAREFKRGRMAKWSAYEDRCP